MGANFSKSSELLQHPTSTTTNTAKNPSTSDPALDDDDADSYMMGTSNLSLGTNRLATGFKPSRPAQASPSIDKSRTFSNSSHRASIGESEDDAIEISSDEEMEDSEGGMIVNVNDNLPDLTNGSLSEDEGLVTTSDDDDMLQIHEDLTKAADVADSVDGASSDLRLLDLNPDELEDQLKYGFYHLDRTQVDLNRLVTCMSCMQLGHLSSDCPQASCEHCEDGSHPSNLCPSNARCSKCRERGHSKEECTTDLKVTTIPCDVCGRLSHVEQECPQRHFISPSLAGPIKLWISCCICASKSHLVGDCPDAPASASSACWSLKSLDPSQITNLSLDTGMRRLERDAETRGMRPTGMQIRGRAGLHQAGVSKSAPISDDEDDFLRPAAGRNNQPSKPQVRLGQYETRRPTSPPRRGASDRYDRFDAPSFDGRSQQRGRGDWYATDSFGRRRSRSPATDSYRPASRRSPSPRRYDGYPQSDRGLRGPPPSDYWHRNQNGLPPGPAPPKGNAGSHMSASLRSTQLPTRKGSNPNLPSKPPTAIQAPQSKQGTNTGGGKRSKKKGKA